MKSLSKSQQGFYKHRQAYSKIFMEIERLKNSQNNFEKKNKDGGIPSPNVKTYNLAIVIKTDW